MIAVFTTESTSCEDVLKEFNAVTTPDGDTVVSGVKFFKQVRTMYGQEINIAYIKNTEALAALCEATDRRYVYNPHPSDYPGLVGSCNAVVIFLPVGMYV